MLAQDAATATPALEWGTGYGLFLVQLLLVLVLVCVGAYLALRFGLRRLYATGARGPIRVVARLPLEPRRTLYLIEVGGKTLLVGASESGPLTTLAELDPTAVAGAVAAASGDTAPGRRRFAEILGSMRRAGDKGARGPE